MTLYEAKIFFQDYYKCKKLYETDAKILASLEDGLQGVDYSKPVVMSSPPNEAPYAGIVELRTELVSQLRAERIELEEIKLKVIAAVRWFPDNKHRELMFLRHISCLKWEEIAYVMNYSDRHCKRLHGEALELYAANH